MPNTSPRARGALLDAKSAAEYLCTTERHIRRLVDEKRIPYQKVGGKLRFDTTRLEAWLEAQAVEPEEGA